MAQIAAMNKQNEAAMAEQMKKMGMNPAEFAASATYDDPELAELDRQMQA